MSSRRQKQVADQIQQVISARIIRGLRDPLPGFVTVREVVVNSDFTLAEVAVSVFGTDAEKAEAFAVINDNRGFLRREVGKEIRLRNTPDLKFVLDDTGEKAARIHQLLNGVELPATDNDA